MSSTTASSARFQSILDAAFDSYAKQTRVELAKHPSMHKLENCHSPDDVLQLLLERETTFQDYRAKHHKLLDSLSPVVQVIHCKLRNAVALERATGAPTRTDGSEPL